MCYNNGTIKHLLQSFFLSIKKTGVSPKKISQVQGSYLLKKCTTSISFLIAMPFQLKRHQRKQ